MAARQSTFNLGGLSTENRMRVQEQNEKTISVIIGNPPYNANQSNFNEFNPNRTYPEIDRRINETYIAESTAQKTKQYDMYKRFIRWASDRLADDGIIAFVTNRKYLDARQDDGFRKMASREFNDIYVLDLGSDVRRNPKIAGTTHNVFGIQTGVAIGFFVRNKAELGECNIHYARREDAELALDKLAYLRNASLDGIAFEDIAPDEKGNWLNQSNSDFEKLLSLANRQTKLAKRIEDEQAVFGLYSLGVITARDEWVYDFDINDLGKKVRAFINSYEEVRAEHGGKSVDNAALGTTIKWTRDLKRQLRLDSPNIFDRQNVRWTLFRPFVTRSMYFSQNLNEMQYQMPRVFPYSTAKNKVICFSGIGSAKPFQVLATDRVYSHDFLEKTQCLPLYRYTPEGERVSNITDWGIRRINDHYREEWGKDFDKIYPDGIGAEDIFAYTYAVLHDPVYLYDYANDLLREFPRLPLYHEFDIWARMGRELLDLHLGFESADPTRWSASRRRRSLSPPQSGRRPPRPATPPPSSRRALPSTGEGWRERVWVRPCRGPGCGPTRSAASSCWTSRPASPACRPTPGATGWGAAPPWSGSSTSTRRRSRATRPSASASTRTASPTTRSASVDLLQRVCTVSVKTMEIVDGMAYWEDGYLVVYGDRDKHEWGMMGLSHWFSEPEDEEWLKQWLEM